MVDSITNYYNAGFIIFDNFFKNILFVKGYLGWGIPKGYYEYNDNNYFETAVREVKEEIGIDINYNNVFDISSSYTLLGFNKKDKVCSWGIKPKGFIKKNYIFYSTKIDSKTNFKMQKDEIYEILWVPIDNVNDIINSNSYSSYEKHKLINSINFIKNKVINL